MQFKSLKIKSDLFDDYFRDTCAIAKKDMIAFLQANSLYSLKESIKNCTAKVIDSAEKIFLLICKLEVVFSQEEYIRVIHPGSAVKVATED